MQALSHRSNGGVMQLPQGSNKEAYPFTNSDSYLATNIDHHSSTISETQSKIHVEAHTIPVKNTPYQAS